ncbi:MAG: hypothetical protein PVG90_05985 [Bacillota bacterium]|jgi:hypothetical protein
MGEQITPEAVGKEIGVRADLRRGHPQPREIKSQQSQLAEGHSHGTTKNIKLSMSKKIGRETD